MDTSLKQTLPPYQVQELVDLVLHSWSGCELAGTLAQELAIQTILEYFNAH